MNYKGCKWLENCLDFEKDFISDCCCSASSQQNISLLYPEYSGQYIDWESLFDKKEQIIKNHSKNGALECSNCHSMTDCEYSNERKIKNFQFTHCRSCQAECLYCSKNFCNGDVNYDTYPIIKDLIDKGYYKSGGEAVFQGGEPTLMKNFEKLVDLLSQNGTHIRILTNGIKCNQKIIESLEKNICLVVISIDSGCKETYKKIKQVDCFDFVCETIKTYIEASIINPDNVMIKYIIIPNKNDSIEEIDKFLKLMKDFQVKNIAIDIESHYCKDFEISPHIFYLYDYFENKAQKYGIKTHQYAVLPDIKRMVKPLPVFMKFKPFLSYYINRIKKKNYNPNYCFIEKQL